MNNPQVSAIATYPLKSAAARPLTTTRVTLLGLENDRRWAVCGNDYVLLTAREVPELLSLHASADGFKITLRNPKSHIEVSLPSERQPVEASIFGLPQRAIRAGAAADEWLSSQLGIDCRLLYLGDEQARKMKPEHGAKPGDRVSFADTSPVMLASEASLIELNAMLDEPVTMANFRANIVLSGCSTREEESWKYIRIGDVEFEVNEPCKRCVFVTIDPVAATRNPQQQPLRTLATYKKHPRGGTSFGMTLIPRKTGGICIGDRVEILS